MLQHAGERQPKDAAAQDQRLEDRTGIDLVGVDDRGNRPLAGLRKLTPGRKA
jgi:hypothetical protein